MVSWGRVWQRRLQSPPVSEMAVWFCSNKLAFIKHVSGKVALLISELCYNVDVFLK